MNLNINFALKPEMPVNDAARYLAAFIRAAKAEGLEIQVNPVKQVREPTITCEKGPFETQYIQQRGLTRMKVPASWNGTREEFAKSVLEQTPDIKEEEEDEIHPFI